MKRLARAVTALALVLSACGDATTLPGGPNPDTFEVITDGEAQILDTIEAVAATKGGTVTIQLVGNRDPVPGAVDDEYAYVLELELDQAVLLGIAGGQSQTVSSSVSYVVDPMSQTTHTLMPEPGQLDLIQSLEFGRRCFCGPEAGSYTVRGELLLTTITPTTVAGAINFTFEGDIPNDSAAKVQVSATFDLPIMGAPMN